MTEGGFHNWHAKEVKKITRQTRDTDKSVLQIYYIYDEAKTTAANEA